MYLMYIDESGNTGTLQTGGSNILVLTGCIIHEENKLDIETSFRDIKKKYYQNPDIEIKSNFLRYANPDITKISSPIKLNDRKRYNELEADIATLLKAIPITLYSVVMDKKAYWEQYPAQNPYQIAYMFLLERFQIFLKSKDSLGLCIIDPREGTVEKKYIDKELDSTHNLMRWSQSEYFKQCPNIIERVLFSTSELTVGIQLTDLYCYPVFHIFEYNKAAADYWRFNDVSLPKFARNGVVLDGVGLKFFPDKTKKDFKFFT